MLIYYLFFILLKLIVAVSSKETLTLKDKSNEIKDEIHSSNNISSELSLNMKDTHDPIVVDLVSRTFHEHKLLIPKFINQIISEYSSIHDKTIDEFRSRIIKELREVTKQMIFLNPYSTDFTFKLLNLINDNKEKISSPPLFWYDLARFLFKYTLLMRKKFANDDELFEESVKNVKNIMIIVDKKIGLYLNDTKLRSMTNFDFSIFDSLMEYEIFDYSHLLELFVTDIIDNQGNLKMTIDEIEMIYCNDNFNNNPLLRLMLIRFAFGDSANKQMAKRGWIASEGKFYQGNQDFVLALPFIYSKEIIGRGDEFYIIETLSASFLSQSMIKFFIDNNLGFRIYLSSDLVRFLRRIDHIEGLPERASIDKIIKFGDGNNEYISEWNRDIFEKYLIKEQERYNSSKGIIMGISQKEYQKYIKLIK